MGTTFKAIVKECIDHLAKRFSDSSAFYFSESDLQSELFSRLLQALPSETMISNQAVWGTQSPPSLRPCISRAVHTELHLPEGRIDIAVLDLAKVKMYVNLRGRFGHMQLEPGHHVFIEVKASRSNRSNFTSKTAWLKSIHSDIAKLNKHKHLCFLLCFDFSGILNKEDVRSLKAQAKRNVKVRYFIDPYEDRWFEKPTPANHGLQRIAERSRSR
jgi:hypothetical protein